MDEAPMFPDDWDEPEGLGGSSASGINNAAQAAVVPDNHEVDFELEKSEDEEEFMDDCVVDPDSTVPSPITPVNTIIDLVPLPPVPNPLPAVPSSVAHPSPSASAESDSSAKRRRLNTKQNPPAAFS
jgi:hypothetical protein